MTENGRRQTVGFTNSTNPSPAIHCCAVSSNCPPLHMKTHYSLHLIPMLLCTLPCLLRINTFRLFVHAIIVINMDVFCVAVRQYKRWSRLCMLLGNDCLNYPSLAKETNLGHSKMWDYDQAFGTKNIWSCETLKSPHWTMSHLRSHWTDGQRNN